MVNGSAAYVSWSFAIRRAALAAVFGAGLTATASAEPRGFLESIHRHVTLTSTVTENGDLNPYAVVVAPVSAGKVMKDDVLVDNFNNISNLQGTGTTIVGFRPSTEQSYLFARLTAEPAAMPRRNRADDGHDDAEDRLGDRRQHTEQGWHDRHQGRWLRPRVGPQWQAGFGLVRGRRSMTRGATWR